MSMPALISYRRLLERTTGGMVAEMPPLNLPDELTLQSLWFAGQFGRDFVTTDGRPVHIVQFGVWNRSAGPDFLNAAVEIDGSPCSGPLELDTRSLDWEQHGHASNPAFDATCLHVVFEDSQSAFFTRTSAGREVPRVVIPTANVVDVLRSPRYSTALAHPGACSTPLAAMSAENVKTLLAGAARHRMEIKSRRLLSSVDVLGWQETLWQGFARVLGYRPNALTFSLLAQRLPIKRLRREPELAEARLFGTAGLLSADLHERAPSHSQDYLRELWDSWWTVRQDHEMTKDRDLTWQYHGIRPTNHPHRRLGALAAIALQWGKVSHFCRREPDLRKIVRELASLEHPFWSQQYTLLSKPGAKKMAIFGKSRAQEFLTNILLPLRLHDDGKTWTSFLKIAAPPANEKVQKAAVRIFGKRSDAPDFLKKAYQHQALLQIYDDFCLQDSTDCAACLFPRDLKAFPNY